jgi:hypothetical protein
MLMETNKLTSAGFAAFFAKISEVENKFDKLQGFLTANQLIMYFTHKKDGKQPKVYGCDDNNRISYRRMLLSKKDHKGEPVEFFTALDIGNKIKNPNDKSEIIFSKNDLKDIDLVKFDKVKEILGKANKITVSNGNTKDNLTLIDDA